MPTRTDVYISGYQFFRSLSFDCKESYIYTYLIYLRPWIFIPTIYHCVRQPNQAYTVSVSFFLHTRLKLTSMWVAHNWFLVCVFILFFSSSNLIKWEEREKKTHTLTHRAPHKYKRRIYLILFSISLRSRPYAGNSRRNKTIF